MNHTFKFNFGDVVADTFSGFVGKVDSVCLTGNQEECRVVGLVNSDRKIVSEWIRVERLINAKEDEKSN